MSRIKNITIFGNKKYNIYGTTPQKTTMFAFNAKSSVYKITAEQALKYKKNPGILFQQFSNEARMCHLPFALRQLHKALVFRIALLESSDQKTKPWHKQHETMLMSFFFKKK